LRDVGRGFGSGTADAACDTRAIAVAPSNAAVQRFNRVDPDDEGTNGITGGLCSESFKGLSLMCSALIMWTKHQMC
jgi:hypothetical protein